MAASSNEEFVKRIARLAKQNQDLEEHLKKLEKLNEKLTRENDKLKTQFEKLTPENIKEAGDSERRESTLKFNMATVLFADIHGLSKLVEGMDSSAIMDELDEILFEFDAIVTRFKIEKIKTIGDTFMCAGGIPVKNITNPVEVVMAAMEMRNFLEKFRNYPKRKEGLHMGFENWYTYWSGNSNYFGEEEG